MKIVVAVALALVCLSVVPATAVQRGAVMIEDFTNWNCPPCDDIQAAMDSIFALNITAGKIAPFRYHVWWPDASDPMYNWPVATADVDERKVYYMGDPGGYVPWFQYDGRNKLDTDPSNYGLIQPLIDSLYAVSSPIRFNFTQQRFADSVRVSFDVIAVDQSGGGLGTSQKIFLAVTELNQNFVTGKEWYIFRDLVPGETGYPVILAVNDSLHFDWAYSTTAAFNATKLTTVLFVQKQNDKVLNALYAPVANPTDVTSAGVGPLRFRLEQNAPNPFNPHTLIPFHIDKAGDVRLTIFDASGRRVTDLVNGPRTAGDFREAWNGLDASGREVSSGVYYYRLESENASETRKMTLLR